MSAARRTSWSTELHSVVGPDTLRAPVLHKFTLGSSEITVNRLRKFSKTRDLERNASARDQDQPAILLYKFTVNFVVALKSPLLFVTWFIARVALPLSLTLLIPDVDDAKMLRRAPKRVGIFANFAGICTNFWTRILASNVK